MADKLGKYRCEICGNIVEVLQHGDGELVCCGKLMMLMSEKTQEQEGKDKPVPVIETTDRGIKIKVASIEHPIEENH